MAVPFYLPEGGPDDTVSSTASGSSTSSDGASGSSSNSSISSSSQSSPNTTATSATQTPMQSPMLQGEQFVRAFFETFCRYSGNNATPIFQYPPPPPSPSCSVNSPNYTGGEVFFPRGRSTPRTPRTSVSFAAGEEINFFHHYPNGNMGIGGSGGGPGGGGNINDDITQLGHQQSIPPPQSAPPIPPSHHHHNQGQLQPQYHHYTMHYQYTPPPTPTGSFGGSCMNTTTVGGTTTTNTGTTMRLHRSHSDAARRLRLTSTGEDEREYLSEHETSWDEFTAGRERLQEFNGRIPPRKKKKDVPKIKPEKKQPNFTWPTVVTVFVFAMGCGFLVAR